MSKSPTVSVNSKSIGFFTILTLIFLTLKLAEVGVVASWSWWLIFAPMLFQAGLVLIATIIVFLAAYFKYTRY